MPGLPRTCKEAKQIAYNILGVPVNMEKSEMYKTKKPKLKENVSQDMRRAEAQEYYRHG